MSKDAWARVDVEGVDSGRVVRVSGREGLSTCFRYVVDVEVDGSHETDVPVGAAATLELSNPFGSRTITGIVSSGRATRKAASSTHLTLELRPRAFGLSVGRDCWAVQDASVVDVLREVLADAGPIQWALRGSYAVAPYRVQYREDDWTFTNRLMEEEGIFYWFDHESGALVIADDSPSSPPIEGETIVAFEAGSGFNLDRELIREVGLSSATGSGRFAVKSFDPARPALKVAGQAGSSGPEVYDAPGGGPSDPAAAQRRAQIGLEGATAARKVLTAETNSLRLYPGRHFELAMHPKLDAKWLVTEVETRMDGLSMPIVVVVRAIPLAVPYRAPRRTPDAKQAGLQMGQVTGAAGTEVHPDSGGRVRVQLHWDRIGGRNDKSGTWMRVAQRCTPGSMLLPRVGWNVTTFNEEGGVDAPSLLCRIHDGEHLPAYPLPGNKTRVVFKTATTPGGGSFNEVYFEDKLGAEEMFIHASKDMNVVVQNQKREVVDNDALRTVGNIHDLTVQDDYKDESGLDQARTVGAAQTVDVGDSRTETVSGNESTTIGGSRRLSVGDGFQHSVGKDRMLAVGAAMLDITLGSISTSGKDGALLVGGAVAKISGASITDTTDIAIQVIGGAKIDITRKSRNLEVEKTLRELVGGSITVTSGGVYTDACDTVSSWTAAAKLGLDSKEILLEAGETIRVKSGESVLTITKDSISLAAPKLDLSGAKLVAKTGMIDHNA